MRGATEPRSRHYTGCCAGTSKHSLGAVGARARQRHSRPVTAGPMPRAGSGRGTPRGCWVPWSGLFFYLTLTIDLYSRKVGGWEPEARESSALGVISQ